MAEPKRILAFTGIRSEYDIIYSPLRAMSQHPGLELMVVASGAHLSRNFGYSLRQIEKDGFPIAERIESLLDSDSPAGRIKSAAMQLLGLVQTLERLRPDFIFVCGDREEAINAALAGAYMNIAVAHLGGGDLVVGNVDDSVRHAVTKLAHLHLVMSEDSAQRVLRLGEERWRVHEVGNPGLDRFRLLPRLNRRELGERLGMELREGPLLLVIQHIISSEIADAARQMEITMDAVAELGYQALVGYPNTDAGSRDIIQVLERRAAELPFVKLYRNLPRLEFVNLLQEADVLLGNSSLGLLEAPFLKLPAVNIGNRQKKRIHAENVIFVPHDKEAIKAAVEKALKDPEFRQQVRQCSCPFGDGRAGERIAEVLAATPVDDRLLTKDWTF